MEVLSEIKEIDGQLENVPSGRRRNTDKIPTDVSLWDTYTRDRKYGDCYSGQVTPKDFPSRWKAALGYLTGMIEQDLNKDFYDKGRKIKYRGFNYGYGTTMENQKGTNYVLDLFLTHNQIKTRKQTKVRKHVYLKQTCIQS